MQKGKKRTGLRAIPLALALRLVGTAQHLRRDVLRAAHQAAPQRTLQAVLLHEAREAEIGELDGAVGREQEAAREGRRSKKGGNEGARQEERE